MVSKGLPLDHDMFSHGNNPHGCGHSVRTMYSGLCLTGADFITNQPPKDNLYLLVETHVDKVNIEKLENGELKATGVRAMKEDGSSVEIRVRKEVMQRRRLQLPQHSQPLRYWSQGRTREVRHPYHS